MRTKITEYYLATDLPATPWVLQRWLYFLVFLLQKSKHLESGRWNIVLEKTQNAYNHALQLSTCLGHSSGTRTRVSTAQGSSQLSVLSAPVAQCHQDSVPSVRPPAHPGSRSTAGQGCKSPDYILWKWHLFSNSLRWFVDIVVERLWLKKPNIRGSAAKQDGKTHRNLRQLLLPPVGLASWCVRGLLPLPGNSPVVPDPINQVCHPRPGDPLVLYRTD